MAVLTSRLLCRFLKRLADCFALGVDRKDTSNAHFVGVIAVFPHGSSFRYRSACMEL